MTKKNNFLISLMKEADAYTTIDQIENFVQEGHDLAHLPVQPLFLAFKSLPVERTSEYLTSLSKEQRQAFLDLDLWVKDELDIESFNFWVKSYSGCEDDDVRKEFITSEEFFLYLKGKFNIWTFDVEDPEYPDHDYYFLTEDNLLLFEYDENFEFVDEIKAYIRELYGEMGVENAYAYLFKLVSDSFMSLQEEEFEAKKGRLRDLGFVDYFEALQIDNCFPSIGFLHQHILKKGSHTGNIDSLGQKQSLSSSALIAYKDKVSYFDDEINKIQNEKRQKFLQFNFMRLVNGTISLGNALKDGPVALTRIGQRTMSFLKLGFEYVQSFVNENESFHLNEGEFLFDRFEFIDFYRIGHSLIKLQQKKIKKGIEASTIPTIEESFFGRTFNEYLDNTFDEVPKYSPMGAMEKALSIDNVAILKEWEREGEAFVHLTPFIKALFVAFKELKESGQLQDHFYLNYKVEEIDLEAILLSTYANFLLNDFKPLEAKKLGLTLDEFRKFGAEVLNDEGKVGELRGINEFTDAYGLEQAHGLDIYLKSLLKEHIEGYDFQELDDLEFQHIGGPIILNIKIH